MYVYVYIYTYIHMCVICIYKDTPREEPTIEIKGQLPFPLTAMQDLSTAAALAASAPGFVLRSISSDRTLNPPSTSNPTP